MIRKTEEFLEELHRKSYDREIDEAESVWRSLPLFTVSFGFAVSLLGYLAGQTPSFAFTFWPLLSHIMLLLPALAFAWAFRWFWNVIRPRTYRYLAVDNQIRAYAAELRAYLATDRPDETADKIDEALSVELKAYVSEQWAEAATHNQLLNHEKAHARRQVAFWLTVGFGLAFISTILTFGHTKMYPSQGFGGERVTGPAASGPASGTNAVINSFSAPSAPASSIYRGGSGPAVPGQPTQMSEKEKGRTGEKPAKPAKPAPPPPTLVVKTGDESANKKTR